MSAGVALEVQGSMLYSRINIIVLDSISIEKTQDPKCKRIIRNPAGCSLGDVFGSTIVFLIVPRIISDEELLKSSRRAARQASC